MEFYRFEFKVFPSRLAAIPRLKSPVCPTIYLQLEGISAMWNVNSLVQDLNSSHWVNFRWRERLHHKYLSLSSTSLSLSIYIYSSLFYIPFRENVEWHINLCRLFNSKAILPEEKQWYYLTHSWEDKGVHTFPEGICPKVNVIAWLEYELAYYDSAVHRFNHYTIRHPLCKCLCVCLCAYACVCMRVNMYGYRDNLWHHN